MTIARKIGFYAIKLHSSNDLSAPQEPSFLRQVLEYIQALDKTDRRHFDEDRFYFLDEVENSLEDESIQLLLFKNAETGKIPPIIDKQTLG
ncbi:MAG: hypothetical protein WBB18_11470, partial [Nodosilinea sp.]